MAFPLRSATAKAADRIAKRAAPHGSILVLIGLIGLALQIIQFVQQQCAEKKAKRLQLFRNPTRGHRLLVRRKSHELCTGDLADYADPLADAILAEAAEASDADCNAVLDETVPDAA